MMEMPTLPRPGNKSVSRLRMPRQLGSLKREATLDRVRRPGMAVGQAARARAARLGTTGEHRRRRFAAAIGAGALAEFFLDPQNGRRRRHVARDRAFKLIRRGSREAARKARYAEGVVEGARHKAADMTGGAEDSRGPVEERLNDPALARKVESEIFRGADSPKGSVNVNVENGIVYLRGELKTPKQIEALVKAAEKVEGVKGVESLLHPPETPAPR